MLGLLLIYWIGKWHYKLAEEFNKSKWGFAILGVVTYYGFVFISAFVIVFAAASSGAEWVYTTDERLLGLIGVPFGLLATWGLHALLKSQWKKQDTSSEQLLDDVEVLD
jgi:hypothetical protein